MSLLAALFALGCSGQSTPIARAPGHASEWASLVAASERGEVETVRILARDLTLGTVPDDHPSASQLGAALGFLQLAEPGDDLAPAVARARAACESCHAERGAILTEPIR